MQSVIEYTVKARRLRVAEGIPGDPIREAKHIERIVRSFLADEPVEVLLVLVLDARNRVMGVERVSRGTLTESPVHPREVFRTAILKGAVHIVLAHNHPSGDPTPSRCDLEVTRRIIQAGEILGIPLLDHVILGSEGYVSIRESGMWVEGGFGCSSYV